MNKKSIDKIKMGLEHYFVFHSDSDRKALQNKGVNIDSMVCMNINGDGMSPTINDGDYLLIDTKKNKARRRRSFRT